MTNELTQEDQNKRISDLEGELAKLRSERSKVHPDVEPLFYVGELVNYRDAIFRVSGRSIDWDGAVTYTVIPATITVGTLIDTLTKQPYTAIVDISHDEDNPVWDVLENELSSAGHHESRESRRLSGDVRSSEASTLISG